MQSPTRNLRRKTEAYMNVSLMSSIGPKTRKASLAANPKATMGAAMKASEVLQSARM